MTLLLAAALQDAPLDLFRKRIGAAKTIHEKALAIRDLGDARDPAAVPALARYLAPQGGDGNVLLVTTAADALAKLRGSVAASRALAGAADALRRHPYLHARLTEAVARVGHESGLALFDEALRGPDPAPAVRSIAAFPASVAVEALLVEGRKVERKGGEGADRFREELVKALQKLTGEKYPSLAEFELWWKKRGPSFRTEAEAREKAAPPPPAGAPLGPVLIVELGFREGGGASTANTGAASGTASLGGIGWSGRVPVAGGPSAGEWTRDGVVELPAIENLKGLASFTISGWVLRKESKEDVRLAGWPGAELLLKPDGRLQLGEASTAPGQVPLEDAKGTDPDKAWRFFAATADASGVKFYVGTRDDNAKLVGSGPRGTSTARPGPLRLGAGRGFRGLIDEVRVHGSAVDGSGALGAEAVVRVQGRPAPAP